MQGWVIMYAWAQFIFGFGIGGEYPMTSTRATEETETHRKRGQRHRGRKVMLAYTMQVRHQTSKSANPSNSIHACSIHPSHIPLLPCPGWGQAGCI